MSGPFPPTFGEFFLRWQFPALLLAIISGFFAGSLSGSAEYRPARMVEKAGLQTFERLPPDPEGAGYFRHLMTWKESLIDHSGPCQGEQLVSEFQERQCEKFWSANALSGAVFLLPLLLAALTFAWGWVSMKSLYRKLQRAEKEIQLSRDRGMGLHHLSFPRNGVRREWTGLYSYFYRLKSAWISGPAPAGGGKRARYFVFFAHEQELPYPGQAIVLVPIGRRWGRESYYGVPDTPQMAVLSAK